MEMLDRILAEHPFFKELKPHDLQIVVGCASNVRFEPGQFLVRADDEANEFYLVRHGKIALEMFVPGRGAMTIQTIGEGEVIGWSWLIGPHQWHFDARAVELTRAIALDGKCLRKKCEEDHDLGYELLKQFAHILEQRLQATRLQLLDIYRVNS